MPHAVFDVAQRAGAADVAARELIPGIAPGGSRAGQATKPALLIRDCWLEPAPGGASSLLAAAGWHQMTYSLKLSQETDLTPGLLLPIACIGGERREISSVGQTDLGLNAMIHRLFHAQGTVWAPRVVGVRVEETGTAVTDFDVHLDYEVVDVPWMDWFIMWDFLDNIVDNEREY